MIWMSQSLATFFRNGYSAVVARASVVLFGAAVLLFTPPLIAHSQDRLTSQDPPLETKNTIYRIIVALHDGSFFLGEGVAISPLHLIVPNISIQNAATVDVAPFDWGLGQATIRMSLLPNTLNLPFAILRLPDGAVSRFVSAELSKSLVTDAGTSLAYLSDNPANNIVASSVTYDRIRILAPTGGQKSAVIGTGARTYGPLFNRCGQLSAIVLGTPATQTITVVANSKAVTIADTLSLTQGLADAGIPAQVAPSDCDIALQTPFTDGTAASKQQQSPDVPPVDNQVPDPETIIRAQDGLAELGFYLGPSHGVVTDALERAVRNFHLNRNLSGDTKFSEAFFTALDAALAELNVSTPLPTTASLTTSSSLQTFSQYTVRIILASLLLLAFFLYALYRLQRRSIIVVLPAQVTKAGSAALIVTVLAPDTDGQEHTFLLGSESLTVVIGRAPGCDLVIDHPSISRTHAEIEVHNDEIFIKDLGGTNGTQIDGVALIASEQTKLGDAKAVRIAAATISLNLDM